MVRRTSRLIRVRKLICLLSQFSGYALCPLRAARGPYGARRRPTQPCRSGGFQKAPAALAAAERPHPSGVRRHTLIRSPCDDQSRATATAAPLSSPRNSTSRRVLRSTHNAGPARQHDRSRPLHALDASTAIPPDSPAGGEVPFFFNSVRTVVGLTCNTRAVSRMPLAFMAISTICRLMAGDCLA
jgi:hypothetical protein